MRRISHVIAVDDAPFARSHRGDVVIVGTAFAGTRLEGVMRSVVRRDGVNATERVHALVAGSDFAAHVQAILVQGIALAGFNVLDIHRLAALAGLPVLVVARRPPDMDAIRAALLGPVPGGRRKLGLIEQAGAMEAAAGVMVQRAGELSLAAAAELITRLSIHGKIPEPLRVAHLIAGAIGSGHSRGRA